MNDKTDSYNVTAEADQAHDDKWLADQIVAFGVERPIIEHETRGELNKYYASNYDFVRDWQVAGAMMEKALAPSKHDYDIRIERDITNDHYLVMLSGYFVGDAEAGDNKSLPRAINEACVEALS